MRTLPIGLMLVAFGWAAPWEANVALVLIMIVTALADARSWRG
jgi:hypothetical protein